MDPVFGLLGTERIEVVKTYRNAGGQLITKGMKGKLHGTRFDGGVYAVEYDDIPGETFGISVNNWWEFFRVIDQEI